MTGVNRWTFVRDAWLAGNIPAVPGCYCLYVNGRVVYVGQTDNLYRRIPHHLRIRGYSNWITTPWGQFPDVLVKCKRVDKPASRYRLEAKLIARLGPKFNRNRGTHLELLRGKGTFVPVVPERL